MQACLGSLSCMCCATSSIAKKWVLLLNPSVLWLAKAETCTNTCPVLSCCCCCAGVQGLLDARQPQRLSTCMSTPWRVVACLCGEASLASGSAFQWHAIWASPAAEYVLHGPGWRIPERSSSCGLLGSWLLGVPIGCVPMVCRCS